MLYLVKLDNAYKIGFTENLKKRTNSYKTSNIEVELLAFREGSLKDEKELHRVLEEYKIRNELYEMCDDVLELFKTYSFSLQGEVIDLKLTINKLRKEKEELQQELKEKNKLCSILEKGTSEIIIPEKEIDKELFFKGELFNIKIRYFKNHISIGTSLYYNKINKEFTTAYGTIAKKYNICGKDSYYVLSGIALTIDELNKIINE